MCPPDAPPLQLDAKVPDRLRDALIAADAELRESFDALRDAVCEHVEESRRAGVSFAETVAELRRTVDRLRTEHVVPPAAGSTDVLVDQLVAWCTEFYGS